MDEEFREDLCKSLARVLVSFQDQYLAIETSDSVPLSGLLCQVWLPRMLEDGATVQLQTKGQPFFIAGSHGADFLALFRCLSCRYEFGTHGGKPGELGAPGRVYLSRKPEFSANVQEMNVSDYHRQSSARLCSVQSCILFPLFHMQNPECSLGVIEIVQNNEHMDFLRISEMIIIHLMRYDLTSCPLDNVRQMLDKPDGPLDMPVPQDLRIKLRQVDAYGNYTDQNDVEDGGGRVKRPVEKASRKLGTRLSNSNLQSLMKKKKIKTLQKHNVTRYEQDVDLSLLQKHEDFYQVPPSLQQGVDSRWNRVQDIPTRCRQSIESDEDFPDGAFAVKSSRSGKMKYWSKKQSSTRISPSGHGDLSPGASMKPGTFAPMSGPILELPSLERLSDPTNSRGNSKDSSGRDKTNSEDWIGMIDPAMVELMMTEDLLGADFANFDDITDLV